MVGKRVRKRVCLENPTGFCSHAKFFDPAGRRNPRYGDRALRSVFSSSPKIPPGTGILAGVSEFLEEGSSVDTFYACVRIRGARTVTRRTYLFISLGNIISLSCAREKSAIESIARPIFCKSYMFFSENRGAFSENWGALFGKLGGIFRKTGGHGLEYRGGFFQQLFSESLTSFRTAPSIHAFGSFFVAATS